MRRLLMTWRPLLVAVLLVTAFMAMPAFAADPPQPPTNVPPPVIDFVKAVLLAAVPLVAWGAVLLAGWLVPQIPGGLKPILATVLGIVQAWLPTVPLGGKWAWILFGLLGLAGTGLDQIIKRLRGLK